MKCWMSLILSLFCISSVFGANMIEVVDGVAARFELMEAEVPEFKDEQERMQKYKRSLEIGNAYLEQGYKQDALRKFIYAFRISPESPDGLFMVGTLLIELEDYAASVAIFEHLEKSYPQDFRLNNNLGWIYCTSEDPQFRDGRKAESYATKALLYAPQDYHVWSTLAEARYLYGNYKGAVRAAKQALMLAKVTEVGESELQEYQDLFEKCQRALLAEEELAEDKGEEK